MKKITAVLICLILLIPYTVSAYNYPQALWGPNTKYIDAVTNKDYNGIIRYGEETLRIMQNAPEGAEKRDIIITRLNEIGIAYAELGDYANSAATFSELLKHTDEKDGRYGDYAWGARARVLQYTPRIEMYIDGGKETYFGAKNEPQNGVLFGTCADGESRNKIPNESMELTYQELGQGLLPYNQRVMAEAQANDSAVLFALNCPRQGDDIRGIKNLTPYLAEISELFNRYPDVPVFLRFGAEFDVWGNQATAAEYIEVFRYVSDYFRNTTSNVAMVWSPNQASNWKLERDDFYPGDYYVDWVGVSLYSSKYFLGDKNQSEFNNIFFKTGDSSDPVLAMEDIVRTYGDRKPIMISEYGAGHRHLQSGEDLTAFAIKRLRETYTYLPIIYPQIKLIAYFDAFVSNGTEDYDFRLSTNGELQKEFIHLTRGGRYIEEDYIHPSSVAYRPVTDNMAVDSVFEIATYAHSYKKELKKVTYFIDGNYVGMSNGIPYGTHIDARAYEGSHTLKSVAEFTDGTIMETEKVINIAPSAGISVKMNGNTMEFLQDPVIYHDTTMVPMRKIFEELGMRVEWNGETRTVTATGKGRVIEVSIDEIEMFVDSKPYVLETAPIILDGSTLVPARAVSEAMNCRVNWNGAVHTVEITH